MSRPFPLPPALCSAVIAAGCCPNQRLAVQGTQAHPSQRDVYVLVGISKFSFKWRTDTEMKQFIQGSAGSLKQEQEWTQIFMFSHRIVHISQCGKDELHWIENVHLDWAHTERQCCGMDINAHLCSRDQGLDKHWLQPHCCSPGDPYQWHKITSLCTGPLNTGPWSQRFHSLGLTEAWKQTGWKGAHIHGNRDVHRALLSAWLEILWDHTEITFSKINSTGSCCLWRVANTDLMDNGKPSTIYDQYSSQDFLCADLPASSS